MAFQWGSWSAYAGGGNLQRFRVGVDYSLSGTTVTVNEFRFEAAGPVYKDVTVTRTGRLSGSRSVAVSTAGNGATVSLGYGGSVAGSRGGSVTVGARVTNILHGLTCSVSVTVPIPALVPSKPGRPSISNVTSSSLRGRLSSAPASNGAGINAYGWETDKGQSATFTSDGRTWDLSGLSANTSYRVRIRARNSVGWGAWSDWSSSATTKPQKPNAPTNVTATRQSDTRQNVSWSVSSTSARPISSQTVQRRETNSAGTWQSWKNVSGTLSGGARSWADTSTVANRQYQYRVVTRNSAGSATSSGSGSIRTTPGVPTGVSAVKQADGSIRVAYTPTTPYADYLTHVLQDNPGGTGWVTVKTQAGSGAITHDDPDPAVTHRYRVATRSTYTNPGTLTSAYSSQTDLVQLLTKPGAPTLTGPSGVLDRGEDIPFTWIHNSVDSSEQEEYQLRYRVVGGGWVTLTGSTAESRTLSALGVSRTVEWQVRTKGAHPDWSNWSAIGSFALAALPTVAINTPDGTDLHQSRVDLLIGYDQIDGSPQSRVQAELVHGGVVVETLSWSGTSDNRQFSTALDDGETYTVRARVQAGNGLWSAWDEVTFTTDFPAPVAYMVEAEWDRDTGSVTVTASEGDMEPGMIAAEFLTIQRRDTEESQWVTLAENVDPETYITDPTPALGAPEYRAISHTTLPSSTTGAITVAEWEHSQDPIFVNSGDGFEMVAKAIGKHATDSPAIEQGSTSFAGFDFPIAVFGEGSSHTTTFQGTIFPHHINGGFTSTRAEWVELLRQRQVVCYRDCQGRKIYGLLSLDFAQDGAVETVAITVDRVWHEEGVIA